MQKDAFLFGAFCSLEKGEFGLQQKFAELFFASLERLFPWVVFSQDYS